jgi:hypothetical protein
MKKNRSRAYVHDRLYALADKLLKRHNPCHGCITHNCFSYGNDSRCCMGCPHFKNGCTVKALYCKLWLCHSVGAQQYALVRRLERLERIAKKYNLLVARASRWETLRYGEALPNDVWWLYHHDGYVNRTGIHKKLDALLAVGGPS